MALPIESRMPRSGESILRLLLALVPVSLSMPACGDSASAASVDAFDLDGNDDVGVERDVSDEETSGEIAVECNAENAYVDWPPEFGVGPAQGAALFSDAFITMAVISSANRESIVLLLDNDESILIRLPMVLAEDVMIPSVGLEVEVTFACSPVGTWCIGDAYVSVRDMEGRLVFEGGEVAALDWLPPEIKEHFLLRYDATPAAEPCTLHTETNSQVCDRTVTPVHIRLLKPDVLVKSGSFVIVNIDEKSTLFHVARSYSINDTCPVDDLIQDWGKGILMPIRE